MKGFFKTLMFGLLFILIASLILPSQTITIAYLIQHHIIFAVFLLVAIALSRDRIATWWALHIKQQGAGGKSNQQSKGAKKK